MRKIGLFAAALLLTVSVQAQFSGDYTVGVGGDYTSLSAASADFSTSSGAVVGNVRFLITSDLTETENSWFGKNTAGFTVTIKPADGVSPTITFTRTNDTDGISGNIIIGASADNANVGAQLVKTDNFIIDGSNDLGNRQLTITNLSTITHSFNSLITIVGDSDNARVINSRIINENTGTASSVAGVRIASRYQTNAPAGTYIPDNFEIVNNDIRTTAATQGHGVNMSGSGTVPAGSGNSNWKVNNNDILARIRGVFINQGLANSEILNNNITIGTTGGNSGFLISAIHVNNANSPPPNTFTVANNRIFVQSSNANTGNFGPMGIAVTSMGSGADRVCNVYNNMIHLMTTNTNNNSGGSFRGIWASSGIAYRFINNSIYIENNPNITGSVDSTRAFCIGGWGAGVGNEAQFFNNLIVPALPGLPGIMRDTTAPPIGAGFVSDNNIITPLSGAVFGRFQSVIYATRAAWNTASGQDANSNDTFNPVTSTPAAWDLSVASRPATLKFTPTGLAPAGMPGFARVTSPISVTTDNEGDSRFSGAGQSWAGADEGTVNLPVAVSAFTVD
jgi:hypothetical protein